MLAARGVSLGLGKINLSEFGHLKNDRLRVSQLRRTEQAEKPPKITIRKKADAKIQSVPADVARLEDIQKTLIKWFFEYRNRQCTRESPVLQRYEDLIGLKCKKLMSERDGSAWNMGFLENIKKYSHKQK
uniref:HTH CENPB-type domain-containing protein n=1 Tax=Angiostrongylus cantonensis TaxID=6313 RepID=A0A0K0DBH6_ANGCA